MQKLNLNEILKNSSELKKKKVGYVAIIGRPNVGKSTFINSLLGEKVSITSNVPQTTRKRVLAIYNDEDSQIIFFDTPGIHESQKDFNIKINKEAVRSLNDSNVILYFIDASRKYGEEEKEIEKILQNISNIPILKIYTKIDLPQKLNILENKNTVKISSVKKTGFNDLVGKIKNYLDIGKMFYPENYYTDQDIYFRISEIIREKVFLNTFKEVPHSVYVDVQEVKDEENLLKIQAYIFSETDSQKYIIIGNKGDLIKKIGTEARIDLQDVFGKKVFLSLKVKTLKKWRKNENIIKNILR